MIIASSSVVSTGVSSWLPKWLGGSSLEDPIDYSALDGLLPSGDGERFQVDHYTSIELKQIMDSHAQ